MNTYTGSTNNKVLHYLQLTVFTSIILYFGKTLFIPASFGLLIAIVMYPVCKWLENRHWSRSLSITISLTIVVVLFGILLWLLSLELDYLIHDIPAMLTKLLYLLPQIKQWISENFAVPNSVLDGLLQKIGASMQNEIGKTIQTVLNATTGTLFMLFMIPVFAALYLYQRETFVKCLELLVGNKFKTRLHIILRETTQTYFRFIKGSLMVYLIVGILNSIGLFALGIERALLYGMLTAFMTIIPYIGILISALLPISVAIITKDSIWYPLGIIGVFAFVQYLEANIIFPRVVATQLNVSTWATLLAIIIGTILWGVTGMILFIPFIAIFKIVTDHVEGWKALNVLLSRGK